MRRAKNPGTSKKCLRRKVEATAELRALEAGLRKVATRLESACKQDVDRQLVQDILQARASLWAQLGAAGGDVGSEASVDGLAFNGDAGASLSPSQMTAGQINKALDKLDAASSKNTDAFIAAGRGHERPSEYLRLSDPLSLEARRISDARWPLRAEIERRYGPGAPSRLPPGRGFGPLRPW